MQYPYYPCSSAKSEASVALLPCVLRPPLDTVDSTVSIFCFGECGGRGQSSGGCCCSLLNSPCPCLGKVAGNRFLLHLWLRSPGQGRQDPQRVLV